ncbi:MAG: DUF523 domain-containing protein [Deltaproteobacteria bacterium]
MTAHVLVSACLLGERVRYDGGHKREEILVGKLAGLVTLVPVCPEVDCGLPIPREPMRLAGDPASPRLIAVKSGTDRTEPVIRWALARLKELESLELCGYVCKRNSPCCSGNERIAVLGDPSAGALSGTGLFTKAFMEHFPEVPVENEGRLRDIALMEMFLEKVFTLRRQRDERS